MSLVQAATSPLRSLPEYELMTAKFNPYNITVTYIFIKQKKRKKHIFSWYQFLSNSNYLALDAKNFKLHIFLFTILSVNLSHEKSYAYAICLCPIPIFLLTWLIQSFLQCCSLLHLSVDEVSDILLHVRTISNAQTGWTVKSCI